MDSWRAVYGLTVGLRHSTPHSHMLPSPIKPKKSVTPSAIRDCAIASYTFIVDDSFVSSLSRGQCGGFGFVSLLVEVVRAIERQHQVAIYRLRIARRVVS